MMLWEFLLYITFTFEDVYTCFSEMLVLYSLYEKKKWPISSIGEGGLVSMETADLVDQSC